MQQDRESIKRMAELLRQGATLTNIACPNCNSPLFRLRDGMLWCAKDEKKVIVVREGEELPPEAQQPQTQAPKTSNATYDKIEATLMAKIVNLQEKIEKTEDVEELQKLTVALSELLNSVDKIKRMKA